MINKNKYQNYLCLKTTLRLTFILILIENSSAAGSCKVDLDCHKFNSCVDNTCTHKSFFPITIEEMSGLLLLCLSSLLANASGIGGGGLYVPILIMFNHFDFKDSIPISKIMIFSGALTSFIYNIKYNIHPERNAGPQLDITLISYMVPFIVLGTQIGIAVNVILPELVLLILMVIVLIFSTVKTTLNSISKYNAETEEMNKKHNLNKIDLELDDSNETSINSDPNSKGNLNLDQEKLNNDGKCSNQNKEQNKDFKKFKFSDVKNVELSLDFKKERNKKAKNKGVEQNDELNNDSNSSDSDDSLEDPEQTSLVSNKAAWR